MSRQGVSLPTVKLEDVSIGGTRASLRHGAAYSRYAIRSLFAPSIGGKLGGPWQVG